MVADGREYHARRPYAGILKIAKVDTMVSMRHWKQTIIRNTVPKIIHTRLRKERVARTTISFVMQLVLRIESECLGGALEITGTKARGGIVPH